jgi:hypothetical protein
MTSISAKQGDEAPMLQIVNGNKIYGGLHAIDGVISNCAPARSMPCLAKTARGNRRSARQSPAQSRSRRATM